MSRPAVLQLLLVCLCSVAGPWVAQTAAQNSTEAPAPARITRYTGCVQRSATDKDTLTLSTETLCAKLTGTLSTDKLVGHEIDLKGVLTDRTAAAPASIHIESIGSVGKPCSDICSLVPPGKRGLKKGELPGKEGGTPGVAPIKPPQ
jgi:hypothetical protein